MAGRWQGTGGHGGALPLRSRAGKLVEAENDLVVVAVRSPRNAGVF